MIERNLHKILLYTIKILPMLISLFYLLNSVLAFFGIDCMIFSIIAGTSLLTLAFMYICSYTFKFCLYHRIFLHYILINNVINIIDFIYDISVEDLTVLIWYLILFCITIFIALYDYQRNKKTIK